MTDKRSLRAMAVIGLVAAIAAVIGAGYLRLGPFSPSSSLSRPPTPLPPIATTGFNDLQAVSGDVAWLYMTALDGRPLLFASSDAGLSWRALAIPSVGSDQKYGIQLIDTTHGLLQRGRGLMSTGHAGRTWKQVPLPPGQSFGLGAHFINANEGWYQDLAAYPNQDAQPSSMWWTTNAGSQWSPVWRVDASHPSSEAIPLNGTKYVLGFNGTLGWLAIRQIGSTLLLETSDGGHMWSKATLPIAESALVYSLQLLPDRSVIILARAGAVWWAITSPDGRTWSDKRQLPMAAPSSDGSYNRPAFVDYRHWFVADGLVIRSTADGGLTWRDVHARLPADVSALHDLWLFSGGRGWAIGSDVGGGFRVLTTRDGGSSWSQAPMPVALPATN